MLFGAIFSGLFNINTQPLVWVAVVVAVFFLVRSLFGPAASVAVLAKLAPRAAKLLTKVESLGLPALAPVLAAVSERRWSDVPALLHTFFDQLDDKQLRRPILNELIDTQIDDQLATPEKREPFLQRLEKKLGVTLPRNP